MIFFFKANLFICFAVSTTILLPAFLAIKVVKSSDSPTETKGYWELNAFGQTAFFKIYSVLLLLVENIIPLITLIVLNKKALSKFKKVMWMVVLDNRRADRANIRFTRLTFTLTFICIAVRTLDTIIGVFNRGTLVFSWKLSYEQDALLRFIRTISFFFLFGAHAFDNILYFIYDKKLKSLFYKDPVFVPQIHNMVEQNSTMAVAVRRNK